MKRFFILSFFTFTSFLTGIYSPQIVKAVSCTAPPTLKGPFAYVFSDPDQHCSVNQANDTNSPAFKNYISHAQVSCATNAVPKNHLVDGPASLLTGGDGDVEVGGGGKYIRNFALDPAIESAEANFSQLSPSDKRATDYNSMFDPATFWASCLYLGYDNYTDCADYYKEAVALESDHVMPNLMRTANALEALTTPDARYTEIKRICDDVVLSCADTGQNAIEDEFCSHMYYLDKAGAVSNVDLCRKIQPYDTYKEAKDALVGPKDDSNLADYYKRLAEFHKIFGIQFLKTLLPGYLIIAPNESLLDSPISDDPCVFRNPSGSADMKLIGSVYRFWFPGLANSANEGIELKSQLFNFPGKVEEEVGVIWDDLEQNMDNKCSLIKSQCVEADADGKEAVARVNAFLPCVSSNDCMQRQNVQPSGGGFLPAENKVWFANLIESVITTINKGDEFSTDQIYVYGAWFVVPGETRKMDKLVASKVASNNAFFMPEDIPTPTQTQQVALTFQSNAFDVGQNEATVTETNEDGETEEYSDTAEAEGGGSTSPAPVVMDGAATLIFNDYYQKMALRLLWDIDYPTYWCYLAEYLAKSNYEKAVFVKDTIANPVGAMKDLRYCGEGQGTPDPEVPGDTSGPRVPRNSPPLVPTPNPNLSPPPGIIPITPRPVTPKPDETCVALNYDLDYHPGVEAASNMAVPTCEAYRSLPTLQGVECNDFNQVVAAAKAAGFNPNFVLAIWAEESWAGNYRGAPQFGCMSVGNTLSSQLNCFLGLYNSYSNNSMFNECLSGNTPTLEEFMLFFSEGVCSTVKDHNYLFCSNENFPNNFYTRYQQIMGEMP